MMTFSNYLYVYMYSLFFATEFRNAIYVFTAFGLKWYVASYINLNWGGFGWFYCFIDKEKSFHK